MELMDNISSKNRFEIQVIDPFVLAIRSFSARNAFCINDVYYTYKDLGEYVSKIRFAIKRLHHDNIHIGLAANDDIETYASIFALWLEGKAYIPLHPKQPLNRSEEIIKQINIITVLDSRTVSEFPNQQVLSTRNLSYENDVLANDVKIDDERLAYVLFTSGSTGIPKGVTISRKNVSAFMDSFWDSGIVITEEDRCLQCFDLTFDVSIQSFLVPLLKGACVYTIPHEEIKYSYVYGLLENYRLTFGAMPPSMLRYLKRYFEEINVPSVRYCILTAEASPIDLVQQWAKCIPNADLYDFYGPTEATIYCTFYKISGDKPNKTLNGMISIGRPMKNVDAIIIDENYNILAKGVKGQLCLSGDHVTPGYWASPEKNAEVFFEKEYKGKLQRFYRTGDICFYDEEDYLMLYGRIDSQAKIQGYRIDLGEIEYHARKYLNGGNVVVLTFTNNIGNTELALFIEGTTGNTTALVDYMKTKIPLYMIPTKIIFEHEFTLNSNSKVDKIKLGERLKEHIR